MLPHHSDAEDVFQRCSLLLWKKFDHYDQQQRFFPWACGIAFYEVRNFLRVASRDRLQFEPELVQQIATARKEHLKRESGQSEALQVCLKSLPEKDQDLLDSFYRQGHACEEIARTVGRSVQTVFNRLSLIRKRLAECAHRRLTGSSPIGAVK